MNGAHICTSTYSRHLRWAMIVAKRTNIAPALGTRRKHGRRHPRHHQVRRARGRQKMKQRHDWWTSSRATSKVAQYLV